jgi:hypothetical protein
MLGIQGCAEHSTLPTHCDDRDRDYGTAPRHRQHVPATITGDGFFSSNRRDIQPSGGSSAAHNHSGAFNSNGHSIRMRRFAQPTSTMTRYRTADLPPNARIYGMPSLHSSVSLTSIRMLRLSNSIRRGGVRIVHPTVTLVHAFEYIPLHAAFKVLAPGPGT